jgi:hypothetical protein
MTENGSFSRRPLIVESKIVSPEGAAIEVEEITLSQAWHDGMARAAACGLEAARQRMLSYRIKRFFSNLFSRTAPPSSGG